MTIARWKGCILVAAPALAVVPAWGAPCSLQSHHSDVTSVQVAYKFIDASFQTDWVYRSLDATLVLPNRKRAPDHVAVEGDSLMATFCLASSELAALGSAWTFAVATRRFTIVPRPTTKMDSRFDEINKKQISLFSMPLIRLADERRPDWVILRSARWQRTADGALRLDIELVNPTEQVFAGSELTLSFEREKTISCRAGPTYQEPKPVPVEIKVQSGTVTVASGDPQYGELVRRPATVKVEGCFEPARVAMSLGPSTSVLAGQAARTRYAVRYVVAPGPASRSTALTDRGGLAEEFLDWKATLSVGGREVLPGAVVVEKAAP